MMASIKITKFTVCQYQWRAFAKYNPLYMYMYLYMQVSLNILTAEPEPPQGKCKFSLLHKNEKKKTCYMYIGTPTPEMRTSPLNRTLSKVPAT